MTLAGAIPDNRNKTGHVLPLLRKVASPQRGKALNFSAVDL